MWNRKSVVMSFCDQLMYRSLIVREFVTAFFFCRVISRFSVLWRFNCTHTALSGPLAAARACLSVLFADRGAGGHRHRHALLHPSPTTSSCGLGMTLGSCQSLTPHSSDVSRRTSHSCSGLLLLDYLSPRKRPSSDATVRALCQVPPDPRLSRLSFFSAINNPFAVTLQLGASELAGVSPFCACIAALRSALDSPRARQPAVLRMLL